jgi:hypothetical protein
VGHVQFLVASTDRGAYDDHGKRDQVDRRMGHCLHGEPHRQRPFRGVWNTVRPQWGQCDNRAYLRGVGRPGPRVKTISPADVKAMGQSILSATADSHPCKNCAVGYCTQCFGSPALRPASRWPHAPGGCRAVDWGSRRKTLEMFALSVVQLTIDALAANTRVEQFGVHCLRNIACLPNASLVLSVG